MTGQPKPRWWHTQPLNNLADILVENARRTPDKVAVARYGEDGWSPVTTRELADEVHRTALGFLAAGVQSGDRVALMARTRYEWTVVDAALWAVGAVVVPVYETSSVEQLRWILEDSGAVAAVVETRSHAAALAGLLGELPDLRAHWVIDPVPGHTTLAELVAGGREDDAPELERRRAAMSRDSLMTLIYTSGTTGRPKGCELTHGNFIDEITSAIDWLPELFDDEDAATLLFLPLAHVFGRMVQVAVLLVGVRIGHSDIARVSRDLPTFNPTFVLAVPRVFERIFDSAQRKAVQGGKGRIFDLATQTAVSYSKAVEGRGAGPLLRLRRAVFDRLVYSKLRAALGERTEWAISGGAALSPQLGHFFRGMGVTILEGYGLTETTAACSVNTRAGTKVGTVGRALPGFEIRISDSGEVLVRGGHVFQGYWKNPEATAAVVDADGWFRTGDLGRLDADGFLTITGRAKEILVTSSGKNVSPGPLEDVLRGHRLVSQALVVGDGRAQIGALLALDAEAVETWLQENGRPASPVAELTEDPALLAELQKAVDAANATVSSAEGIKRFRVLPVDLTQEAGHITPTLKVRRHIVAAEFADDIEALYARKH